MNRRNPNPFDGPLFVVTHRTEDAPDPSTGFHFVDGLEAAMQRATGRDLSISGGADVIRQVARLAEIPAPVTGLDLGSSCSSCAPAADWRGRSFHHRRR